MRDVERALARLATADVNLLLRGENRNRQARARRSDPSPEPDAAADACPRSRLRACPRRVPRSSSSATEGAGGLVAAGGAAATLYLEHIETLSPRLQRRLVQALDTPGIGGDLRVIAGTTVELEELVRLGRFRARPLLPSSGAGHDSAAPGAPRGHRRRSRTQFVKQWCERTGSAARSSSAGARSPSSRTTPGRGMRASSSRRWRPCCVRRAAATSAPSASAPCSGAVRGATPRRTCFRSASSSATTSRRVLSRCNWNQSLAARRLGIGRNTLMRKIKTFGLDKAEVAA